MFDYEQFSHKYLQGGVQGRGIGICFSLWEQSLVRAECTPHFDNYCPHSMNFMGAAVPIDPMVHSPMQGTNETPVLSFSL